MKDKGNIMGSCPWTQEDQSIMLVSALRGGEHQQSLAEMVFGDKCDALAMLRNTRYGWPNHEMRAFGGLSPSEVCHEPILRHEFPTGTNICVACGEHGCEIALAVEIMADQAHERSETNAIAVGEPNRQKLIEFGLACQHDKEPDSCVDCALEQASGASETLVPDGEPVASLRVRRCDLGGFGGFLQPAHGHELLPAFIIDGATKGGPWAWMCPACHAIHGRGLGTGKGQKYVNNQAFRKVEG